MGGWIVHSIAVSTVVGVGALLVERGMARWGRPLRWIWIGAFFTSFLVVLLPVPVQVTERIAPAMEWGEPIPSAWLTGAAPAEGAAPGGTWGRGRATVGAPERIFVAVWLGVTGLLLIRFLLGAVRVGRARRRWSNVPSGLTVAGRPVLLSADTGPAVVGILRSQVVIPRWCLAMTGQKRALILEHEAEHIRARDPSVTAAAYLLTICVPWNAPFWFFLRRLQHALEVDCDARVLEKHPAHRRGYADLLLAVAARGTAPAPAPAMFAERNSSLSRRILMLTRPSASTIQRGALIAVGGGLLFLAVSCLVPGPDRNGDSPTEPVAVPDEAQTQETAVTELALEPTFTPFTTAPEVMNRARLQEALREVYPEELRSAGVGGTTILHIFIDEEGDVRNVLVAEPSGHPALDEAAMEVGSLFEFGPALNRDEPVPVWIQIPITFQTGEREEGGDGAVRPDGRTSSER
jgi:TonB family protein